MDYAKQGQGIAGSSKCGQSLDQANAYLLETAEGQGFPLSVKTPTRIAAVRPLLRVGDRVTFTGQFRRRTVWDWILRRPRVLQTFTIGETVASDDEHA